METVLRHPLISRLKENGAPALICLAAAVLFMPFFALGRVFVPGDFLKFLYPWRGVTDAKVHNLDLFDTAVLYHPMSEFLSQRLHLGDIPLWDPNMFCGFPLVAIGYGVLYPPRLMALSLFSAPVGMTLLWFLHVLAMGLGMYGWLRSRNLSKDGAALAGLCWMLSSLNSAWLTMDFSFMAAYLAPMLWAFDTKRWGLLALFGGLCLNGGHVQMSFYLGFIVGTYALAHSLAARQPKRVLGLAASAVGVLLIACPGILPFLELLSGSQRDAFSWQTIQSLAASLPTLLVTMLNPDIFGNPSRGFMLARTAMNYPFCEYADYIGVIPIVFAVLALVYAPRSCWGAKEVRGWGTVGLVALLFAAATPLYQVALFLVPPLSKGLPGRFLVVVVFVSCVLAAHGYEAWRGDERVRTVAARVLAAISIVALVGLMCAFWCLIARPAVAERWITELLRLNRVKVPAQSLEGMVELCRQGMIENYLGNPQFILTVLAGVLALFLVKRPRFRLLFVFIALDLLLHFSHFNTWMRPEEILPKAPSITYLQEQPGLFRVEKQAAAFYNTLTPYNLSLVTGYSGVIPSRFFQTIGRAQNIPALIRSIDLVRFESPILSAMNLTYLMQGPVDLPAPIGWEKVYDNEVRIFRNPRALPRAFVRGQVREFSSLDQLLDFMGSPAFNPWKEVLIETPLPGRVESSASQGTCTIRHYQPDLVAITADLPGPGVLVLSDSWYPGWRCRDAQGKEYEVVPVNGSMRGVYLEKGQHELRFSFEPPSFYLGLQLAAVGLTLALAHTLWRRRRRL